MATSDRKFRLQAAGVIIAVGVLLAFILAAEIGDALEIEEDWSGNTAIALPLLAIFGVVILILALTILTTVTAILDLNNRVYALGLPQGSIRAVIALGLLVAFLVIAIFLYIDLPADEFTTRTVDSAEDLDRLKLEERVIDVKTRQVYVSDVQGEAATGETGAADTASARDEAEAAKSTATEAAATARTAADKAMKARNAAKKAEADRAAADKAAAEKTEAVKAIEAALPALAAKLATEREAKKAADDFAATKAAAAEALRKEADAAAAAGEATAAAKASEADTAEEAAKAAQQAADQAAADEAAAAEARTDAQARHRAAVVEEAKAESEAAQEAAVQAAAARAAAVATANATAADNLAKAAKAEADEAATRARGEAATATTLYDVTFLAPGNESKVEFAKQTLTTLSTLLVAMVGFYFGSRTVASARGETETAALRVTDPKSPYVLKPTDKVLPITLETKPKNEAIAWQRPEGDETGQIAQIEPGKFEYRRSDPDAAEDVVTLRFSLARHPDVTAELVLKKEAPPAEDGGAAAPPDTPKPEIEDIQPDSFTAGAAEQKVVVSGKNIVAGASVKVDGQDVQSAAVRNNPNKLSVTIPAAMLASQGKRQITVVNPDGTASDPKPLTVG